MECYSFSTKEVEGVKGIFKSDNMEWLRVCIMHNLKEPTTHCMVSSLSFRAGGLCSSV